MQGGSFSRTLSTPLNVPHVSRARLPTGTGTLLGIHHHVCPPRSLQQRMGLGIIIGIAWSQCKTLSICHVCLLPNFVEPTCSLLAIALSSFTLSLPAILPSHSTLGLKSSAPGIDPFRPPRHHHHQPQFHPPRKIIDDPRTATWPAHHDDIHPQSVVPRTYACTFSLRCTPRFPLPSTHRKWKSVHAATSLSTAYSHGPIPNASHASFC